MNDREYLFSILVLIIICISLGLWTMQANTQRSDRKLGMFKLRYMTIYALVNMSDWLQGPYTYSLYKSYGYDLDAISLLFVVGFLSSAIFGTIAGSLVDRYGRKTGCIAFCIIYIISCLSKPFSNFQVLIFGRITGGLATSLLFSAFESWLVAAHTLQGFNSESLGDIFSDCVFLNGVVAIISGFLANISVAIFGFLGPFYLATFVLLIAATLISYWFTENYGTPSRTLQPVSFLNALKQTIGNYKILSVGIMQSCMETAMYSFVFLWAPVLEERSTHRLPFGMIFSAFMISIMCGSILVKKLVSKGFSSTSILGLAFSMSTISFTVVSLVKVDTVTYIGFNVYELCCGLYFPTISTIRSQVIPEESRSTIMNIFRIPLNLLVVLMLRNVKDFGAVFTILTFVPFILAVTQKQDNYKPVENLETSLAQID